MFAAFCVLGPLTCVAHAGGINGEATYVSFQVPGALGTYPMSINNSMTVTGYYYVTPTQTRGFVRDADGTITTFDVDVAGVVWIEPESINARGDITGFYELAATPPQPPYDFRGNQPQGFSGTPMGASSNSTLPKSLVPPRSKYFRRKHSP